MTSRRLPAVLASTEARAALRELGRTAGPVIIVHPPGAREGKDPIVVPTGEFPLGRSDLCLGYVEDAAVFVSERDLADGDHADLEVDVEAGHPAGFSLGAPGGRRFVTRWRADSASPRRFRLGARTRST